MKKFIVLALCLGLITSAHAQMVGIKGGLSVSNLSTSDGEVEQEGSRTGWTAGVFMNLPIIDNVISLQPELLYTQKGGEYEVLGVDVDAKSAYIEVPILAQLTIFQPLYIYAGPQFSYLSSVETIYNEGGFISATTDNDEDNYERWDVGGAAGIGLMYKNLIIDARVSLGAINFDKDRTIESVQVEARNLKNFNFQLTAGFGF